MFKRKHDPDQLSRINQSNSSCTGTTSWPNVGISIPIRTFQTQYNHVCRTVVRVLLRAIKKLNYPCLNNITLTLGQIRPKGFLWCIRTAARQTIFTICLTWISSVVLYKVLKALSNQNNSKETTFYVHHKSPFRLLWSFMNRVLYGRHASKIRYAVNIRETVKQ